MAVKVFAVRIGDRYNIEHEKYLKNKISNIEIINEAKEDFKLQWNKLHFFNSDLDEPICVIDIDIQLINEYQKLFEYPIERGEFLTIDSWWSDIRFINGGFYKFYPKDTQYIYEEFKKNKLYWEEYFIKNGLKPGPVNGEEDFVWEMVKHKLKVKYLPSSWATMMKIDPDKKYLKDLNKKYSKEYVYLGNKFNDDVKFVHYLGLNQLLF